MTPFQKEIGNAVKVEVDDLTGEVRIIFVITDPSWKERIKKEWINEIEFEIKNKKLML